MSYGRINHLEHLQGGPTSVVRQQVAPVRCYHQQQYTASESLLGEALVHPKRLSYPNRP